jgi:hypothetical protein
LVILQAIAPAAIAVIVVVDVVVVADAADVIDNDVVGILNCVFFYFILGGGQCHSFSSKLTIAINTSF